MALRKKGGPWSCYQCGKTFHDPDEAESHFGLRSDEPPTCLVGEQGAELERLRIATRRQRAEIENLRARIGVPQ